MQRKNTTKINKINRHAIPLDQRQRMPKTIQNIYWRPGKSNYAEYWTKHHPETHHKNTRKQFLTPHIILEMLQLEQEQHKISK